MATRLVQHGRRFMSSVVNKLYQPGIPAVQAPKVGGAAAPALNTKAVLQHHRDRVWPAEEVSDSMRKHALFTWGATNAMNDAAIQAVRGEGVYFYDASGKKYIDFNSMAMCVNLGHSPHPSIIKAVSDQMSEMAYAYPGVASTPVRAKLCKLLADIVPGDINNFIFPSSGAEANECAIRMSRLFTGRHKIFARYRSYHGGTLGAMGLTGDQRRWPTEPFSSNGVVHFFDPYPYSFAMGATEEEVTERSLTMLKEQLMYENPKSVAAIHIESITGTNGVLKPPKGYLEGLRKMCDEFGILLVCDEVMAGFGRSGKLFGFMHAPSVIPDIITFAKGLNGAYLPLGGVGVRDHVAEYFRKSPLGYGSTYNGHPVALASAYASLKVLLEQGLVENAAAMEPVMQKCMTELADKHPCIKQARVVGLFGVLDLQKNKRGDFIAAVTDAPPPAMAAFKKELLNNGLFTMMRGHNVFTNPPLIINKKQIEDGFAIIDKALTVVDNAMEK
eukprot:TRINITY_DN1773_c0_g1_i1.p1 TRINITY_DN1773_c0_g1~~TRINITY_DN1773_c0_g1_i1.p1  ORF type:complete len:516 (+),score=149.47 TRINITY_DN1773_c0_g1_i1:47-1549(+)